MGSAACLSSASTTGRPRVRFGTKWLSITSTCSQSAVSSTALASSASRAKSADRMLGEICTAMDVPSLTPECHTSWLAFCPRFDHISDGGVPPGMSSPAMLEGFAVEADLLDRVRKLLAKAEDEGCSPAEAEALTAKAAELMARYGIDRALLGALRPETDRPADRVFILANPWGDVKRHLLAGLATALRCQCVQTRHETGTRLHVFGYLSDLERADILFTSLLVQMARALARQPVPGYGGEARAWRRSWMLGFSSAVVARVRAAEEAAVASADGDAGEAGPAGQSAALVLADRSLTVRRRGAGGISPPG